MDNKIKATSDCIEQLANIMEYINNMQTLPDPNNYVIGFRLGIILSELNVLQQDIIRIQRMLQDELGSEQNIEEEGTEKIN